MSIDIGLKFKGFLFLDVETVPSVKALDMLDERGRELFKKRFNKEFLDKRTSIGPAYYDTFTSAMLNKAPSPVNTDEDLWQLVWQDNASFHAEFNQIVCIVVGGYQLETGELKTKSLIGTETEILSALSLIIEKKMPVILVAHNGKNFDFPLIQRKMTILEIKIPMILRSYGRKAWELSYEDTQDIWACGEFNKKISLDRLAWCLGIESPKDVMDGSMVADYYYDGKIAEIASYCTQDVVVLGKVFAKLKSVL
jgi:hypothetical protein